MVPVLFNVGYLTTWDGLSELQTDNLDDVKALKDRLIEDLRFKLRDKYPREDMLNTAMQGIKISAFVGTAEQDGRKKTNSFVESAESVLVVEQKAKVGSSVFDKISGLNRMQRTMDIVQLNNDFEQVGTTPAIALIDVWDKMSTDVFKEEVLSVFIQGAEVTSVLRQLVFQGIQLRKHCFAIESWFCEKLECILTDVDRFIDADGDSYEISQEKHGVLVGNFLEGFQLAVDKVFPDADMDAHTFIREGAALDLTRPFRVLSAHPFSVSIGSGTVKEIAFAKKILGLLEDGLNREIIGTEYSKLAHALISRAKVYRQPPKCVTQPQVSMKLVVSSNVVRDDRDDDSFLSFAD
jgi:hypothetical protein